MRRAYESFYGTLLIIVPYYHAYFSGVMGVNTIWLI